MVLSVYRHGEDDGNVFAGNSSALLPVVDDGGR